MSKAAQLPTKTVLVSINYQRLNNRTNRFENKSRVIKLKK